MIRLLIVADDFTGALDTGVKFAQKGTKVLVVTNPEYELAKCGDETEVLVVDAETRHLSAGESYKRVYSLVKQAAELKVPYIMKKTDSALRGNIGSELEAALEATGRERIHFLPAMPGINRIVKDGILYINGVPVSESMFGSDPFEPVYISDVAEIVALQSTLKTKIRKEALNDGFKGIVIYDSEKPEDLQKITKELEEQGELALLAGCAGLAEVLQEKLGIDGKTPSLPDFEQNLIVACGSVNPITKRQLDVAEKNGFTRIRISTLQKLQKGYFETNEGKEELDSILETCKTTKWVILDTNDEEGTGETAKYCKEHKIDTEEMRVRISTALGSIVKTLVNAQTESTFLITGGDCLHGFMDLVQVHEMVPIAEVGQGTVLSKVNICEKAYYIISKSGGFGSENIIVDLRNKIKESGKGGF